MMLKYFQGLMQGRFHSSICYSVPNSWCTNSKKGDREKKKKKRERKMEKKVTEMEKEGKKKKNEANKNVTETTDVKIN